MSEYQYHEFRALDRRLTAEQQRRLRSLSSRAEISATRLANEYSFGNFRGDPGRLLEEYFDAYLYAANWGTRELAFRLPRALLDPETARRYCDEEHRAWVTETAEQYRAARAGRTGRTRARRPGDDRNPGLAVVAPTRRHTADRSVMRAALQVRKKRSRLTPRGHEGYGEGMLELCLTLLHSGATFRDLTELSGAVAVLEAAEKYPDGSADPSLVPSAWAMRGLSSSCALPAVAGQSWTLP